MMAAPGSGNKGFVRDRAPHLGDPNGWKVSVLLEALELPYRVVPVDIRAGAQFAPAFRAISPAAKIPAIVDPDGPGGRPLALAESTAILVYLAEKAGSPLLPTEPRARFTVLQWLMWEAGGVGPTFAQAFHFLRTAPRPVPRAEARFGAEVRRLYGVLDGRLARSPFVAGEAWSLADVALYPSVARHPFHGVELSAFRHVERWYAALSGREAIRRGMAVPG